MYNFIVKNLKHGHWVAVRDKFNDWMVFTYLRPDGDLEGTVSETTIEESKETGLGYASYSKLDIENDFTDEHKILTHAPVLLEPGTKVEILENVRELAEKEKWGDVKIDMIGKKGFEIKNVYGGDYCVYNEYKSEFYAFPHWAVAPIYEPENKIELSDEELIAELDKRGRLKDKKVIE